VGIVASLGVRLFADLDNQGFKDAADTATDLVTQFISVGSHIADLSERSSIGTTQLQRLSYAGDLVGVSMDQIASAATMLQKRLGSGNDGTVGALADLNLNFTNLKSLDPGQQFEVVATALGKVDNATERARIGQELFGRGWSTILPLAKQDLQALGDEAELFGAAMGPRLIDTADQAGDSWTKLTNVAKGLIALPIASVVDSWNKVFRDAKKDTEDWAKTWEVVTTLMNRGNAGPMPNLPGRPGSMNAGGIVTPSMTAKEIADIERELGTALRQNNTLLDERAKKTKEFWAWLNDGPVQWKAGLSSMPGHQIGWKMPEIPWANGPKMQSGISGSLPVSSMLGWGTPQEYAAAFAPPPGTFEKIAADMRMQAVPSFKEVGLSSAKSLIESLGQGIATGNWSGFVSALGNSFKDFATSAISQGINLLIPGLGTLLQPLIGGFVSMIGGLFDRHKGRDSVVAFAAEMGGFDALHAKLLQLGAEGEALWVKLTQGTPSGNKDIAKANIEQVIAALERQRAAGATATDGLLGDLAMVPGAAAAAGASLDELKTKYGGWTTRGGVIPQVGSGESRPDITGGGLIRERGGEIYDTNTGESRTYTGGSDPRFNTLTGSGGATVNVTVNGSADRDFAARLAKAIADGGGLRTEWQAAVG
jgi:hypothetical protein